MSDSGQRLAALLEEGLGDPANFERALARTGELVDSAYGHRDQSGLETALEWAEVLAQQEVGDAKRAELEYFIGNAWAGLHTLRHEASDSSWGWEIPEVEAQVLHLRRALRLASKSLVHPIRRCQIHTNLGNIFSNIGRFVDAVDEWDNALALDPSFAMAIGNRGKGLFHYCIELYDPGHQGVFAAHAARELARSLTGTLEPGAGSGFAALLEQVERICAANEIDREFDLDAFELGASESEIVYRTWCLENRLFLNPINDVGPYAIAARDVLLLPSLRLPIGQSPSAIGFYNQLKQEFVSARFLFFEALHAGEPHFSDSQVKLINTLDYPAYSLAVEKVKGSFRTFYSVLDKIAFFLNDYMALGVPGHKTQIRTIWYEKQRRKRGIREEFAERQNWPLRGLYWLTKDLSEDRPEFVDAMSPDAREVASIRNHLEHKYLKLHDELWSLESREDDDRLGLAMEGLAKSVRRDDFEKKTHRLMKLTRAALIYLSLAVHVEERRKEAEDPSIAGPMTLDTWDDEWKV